MTDQAAGDVAQVVGVPAAAVTVWGVVCGVVAATVWGVGVLAAAATVLGVTVPAAACAARGVAVPVAAAQPVAGGAVWGAEVVSDMATAHTSSGEQGRK